MVFAKKLELDFSRNPSFYQRDELPGAKFSTLDVPNSDPSISFHLPHYFAALNTMRKSCQGVDGGRRGDAGAYIFYRSEKTVLQENTSKFSYPPLRLPSLF